MVEEIFAPVSEDSNVPTSSAGAIEGFQFHTLAHHQQHAQTLARGSLDQRRLLGTVYSALLQCLIARHGVLHLMTSSCGAQFISNIWDNLSAALGIELKPSGERNDRALSSHTEGYPLG